MKVRKELELSGEIKYALTYLTTAHLRVNTTTIVTKFRWNSLCVDIKRQNHNIFITNGTSQVCLARLDN